MSATQGPHSLAFRVMRLCKPSFQVDPPVRIDPIDLLVGEDIFDDAVSASRLPPLIDRRFSTSDSTDLSFRNRFLLRGQSDSMGLPGLLLLPQAFGAIYLGETFCSYVSINNSSSFEVRDVVIKAEMQTERQRILLLDTSKSPVETIRAGGRYDFIVEHDVKELGAHTLVCSAMYSDGETERKYLPQFFKFVVANPLSVKTKVRVVKIFVVNSAFVSNADQIYLVAGLSYRLRINHGIGTPSAMETTFVEACIENHAKSNLYMDQVEFEPAQHWSATALRIDEHQFKKDSLTSDTYKPPVLIRSGGGIQNYLFQLKLSAQGSEQVKIQGSNVLGKLQITWRTNLGEPGRLQTQQILGTPITHKNIELHVVKVPTVITLNNPFSLHLNLTNQTDKELGPFEVTLSQNDLPSEKAAVFNGFKTLELPQVDAFSSTDLHLNLTALKLGVQKITGVTVFDTREKKTYEPLIDLEIFVALD